MSDFTPLHSRPTIVRNVRNKRKQTLAARIAALAHDLRDRYKKPEETDEAEQNQEDDEPRVHWATLFGFAAALVCIGLSIFVYLNFDQYTARTQQFHVAEFNVSGFKRVTKQAVIDASGVAPGSSLMGLDALQVQVNIEKLPWVRKAAVQQILPSTLAIEVMEYQPYALVLAAKMLIVDKNGFVFKEAEVGEAGDLPIITGFPAAVTRDVHIAAQQNSSDTPTQRRLRDLLRLIDAHAQSALATRFPLSEVHYDPVLGTTLISARDGAEVRLGRMLESDVSRSFTMIGRLLDRLDDRGEALRYALLDDDVRQDRAVVASALADKSADAIQRAGAPAGVALPAGATPTLGGAAAAAAKNVEKKADVKKHDLPAKAGTEDDGPKD